MNADGGDVQNITNSPDAAEDGPDFSPDGTRIVFLRREPAPSGGGSITDVHSIGVNGAGETRLTDAQGADGDPVFSPDGTKIAFRSGRRAFPSGGRPEIFTMNADGSNEVRLTTAADRPGQGDTSPSWQPIRPSGGGGGGAAPVGGTPSPPSTGTPGGGTPGGGWRRYRVSGG